MGKPENCNGDELFRSAGYNAGGADPDSFYDDLVAFTPKFHLTTTETSSDSSIWTQSGAATDTPENIYAVGLDGVQDGDERVGIGTSSPTVALDVVSSAAGGNAPFLRLHNASGDDAGAFGPGVIFDNGIAGKNGFIIQQYQTSGALGSQLSINNLSSPYTSYLTITQGGYVGIGTTTPEARLHVLNTISGLTTGLKIDPYHVPGVVAGTVLQAQDAGGGANRVLALQPNGGGVGIGTGQPTAALDVWGTTVVGNQPGSAAIVFSTRGSMATGDLTLSTAFAYQGFATYAWFDSDGRLKKNIHDLPMSGLETVAKLRPVSFEWKKPSEHDI
ncbi:MAG: tail fiber domain-containing protein, partial [Rickettsiales bacterium]